MAIKLAEQLKFSTPQGQGASSGQAPTPKNKPIASNEPAKPDAPIGDMDGPTLQDPSELKHAESGAYHGLDTKDVY